MKRSLASHPRRPEPLSPRTGSAIFAVVLVMTAITLVVASLLQLGLHESKMNKRHVADMEGRNAVESAIEIASAYCEGLFDTQTTVTGSNISFSLTSDEQQAILANLKYVTAIQVDSIVNKTQGKRVFIDPRDPQNLQDPHKGKNINISEWTITATATVNFQGGTRDITATQTFQVREAPLFTHAIFYNLDLEFHPGKEMIISGPVHTNGDLWVVSKAPLYFQGLVTATGNINVGMAMEPFQFDWSTMTSHPTNESSQSGAKVYFNNGKDSGSPSKTIDGKVYYFDNLDSGNGGPTNNASTFIDSRTPEATLASLGYADFADYLVNTFSGMVMSGDNVAPLLPLDMDPYRSGQDDVDGDGTIDSYTNPAYALIEPPAGASNPADGTTVNPAHKGSIEKDKFSYKSGLTFEIVYQDGSKTLPDNAVQLVRKDGDRASGDVTDYYVIPKKIVRSNPHDLDSAITTDVSVLDADGNTVTVPEVTYERVYMTEAAVDEVIRLREYREGYDPATGTGNYDTDPVDGIYDRRRGKAHDLVSVDIEAFNQQVVDTSASANFVKDGTVTFNPASNYNGVVYFEFPSAPPDSTREDKVVVAQDTIRQQEVPKKDRDPSKGTQTVDVSVGLVVENASEVPNPTYNHNNGRSEGFTLATNGQVYVKGHFNADGDPATGSSTEGDNSADAVAAVVGDAVTILSPYYDFSKSRGKPDASFTEFNGAFITGMMPTNKGGQQVGSGGNHNLPRFLENWSGDEFRYRGSMVVLFESELANEPWNTSYYSPPTRVWGFFTRFGQGDQPPGTPVLRTYFKLDFRYDT